MEKEIMRNELIRSYKYYGPGNRRLHSKHLSLVHRMIRFTLNTCTQRAERSMLASIPNLSTSHFGIS